MGRDPADWQRRGPDEWRPWAEAILAKAASSARDGIAADEFDGYPSPVQGFCFELYGSLPYSDWPFTVEVLRNMRTLPGFAETDAAFRARFGCAFIDIDRELAGLLASIEEARGAVGEDAA